MGMFKSAVNTLSQGTGIIAEIFGSNGLTTQMQTAVSGASNLNVLFWVLTVAVLFIGANGLWRFVHTNFDEYLLSGGVIGSAVIGLGIYFKLNSALNGSLLSGESYTFGELLKALHQVMHGSAAGVQTTPAGQAAYDFYQEYASKIGVIKTFMKNLVDGILGVQHWLLAVGIVAVLASVLAIMGLSKGWGKRQNG